MLLRIFKNQQIYNLFIIPVLGIIFWMKAFLSPLTYNFFPGEDQMPLYSLISNLIGESVLLSKIVAFFCVLVIVFLLVRISTIFGFLRTKSFLPGTVYIILLGGFTNLQFLHPVLIGTIFLLLCIYYLFDAYNQKEILYNCFVSGFLLGLGSLVYFPLIFFLPILIIGSLILGCMYNWRHFILPLVGALTPWFITGSLYFLNNSFPLFRDIIHMNNFHSNPITAPKIVQYYSFFILAITIPSSAYLMQYYDMKKISSRKYLSVLAVLLVFSAILPIIYNPASVEMVVILLIPIGYFITHFLLFMNIRIIKEMIFLIMLGFSIFAQFVN